jgi:hypothetical protein
MSYTAGDQINRALRIIGMLAEGETPSADTSADALMALNQMIDSWNTERLSTYTMTTQSFTWTGGNASQTLGPTGDLVGTRPVRLDPATYYMVDDVSYPLRIITQQQYNNIILKDNTSTLPQYLYYNPDLPDITMYLYPVPSADITIKIVGVEPLDEPASLVTVLSFPPGYMRAFAYNLAVEIASEFGIEPPPNVRRIASAAKRNIKRINTVNNVMVMPWPLNSNNYYGGNIYTGWY